jgi:NAD(P)-dependent dehydrogenase (short-subunit alcohol dehydrogenase family)
LYPAPLYQGLPPERNGRLLMKTALITGANHGLGLSLTNVFLDRGFTVLAGVYRPDEEAQIHAIAGREALFLVGLDVSDDDSVAEAVRFAGDVTQTLDVVINNAAIIPRDEILGPQKTVFSPLDFEAILEAINVNAVGALRVANGFAPFLKRGETKLLINISSEAGSISDCYRDDWFGYCMSKAALNMAGALIQHGMRDAGGQVWQIHPGWMQTYMSGEKNEAATYTSDFSAERIFELVQNAEAYRSPKAVYMDLFGNQLDW